MFKNFSVALVILALVLGLGSMSFAQQAAPGSNVTITGARGDAATRCDAAAAGTLTLQNPGPGLSDYITMIGNVALASGVPTAATPTVTTMTGIAGTTPSFMAVPSVFPAAGAQGSVAQTFLPLVTPIKCLAGTACAIVPSTAVTNFPQTIEACYYAAP